MKLYALVEIVFHKNTWNPTPVWKLLTFGILFVIIYDNYEVFTDLKPRGSTFNWLQMIKSEYLNPYICVHIICIE